MSEFIFLWTAFIIGLAGSFHCVGMCGPIALALPGQSLSPVAFTTSRILYNMGRIAAYSVLGALFGLFGHAFALAGFQQIISIALGILLLMIAIFSLNFESRLLSFSPFHRFNNLIKNLLGKLLKSETRNSFFSIGFLNGLLPCGFVYIGLFGSVATGNIFNGMLYMTFFGLGTFPLMFAVASFGKLVDAKKRALLRKLTPVFLVVFACVFIIRGLDLGIPYLSPKINPLHVSVPTCH